MLTENAIKVLEARYLIRNERGEVTETPDELFMRVAETVARAERFYGTSVEEEIEVEKRFYESMRDGVFLPNTPTLVNAGRPLGMLSACFVLPISDCLSNGVDGIMDSLVDAAIIQKAGGGTGFSFSELRPSGAIVQSTKGVASGPVSFMQLYDAATDAVKQGGTRRGANMGILRVDHPDIMEFIRCKSVDGKISNFNISVAVTDEFMDALDHDDTYELIDPSTGEAVSEVESRDVWDAIVEEAWRTGEPGIFFIDTVNIANPVPQLGDYSACNPCSEKPLLPYDSCNLGSIRLSHFVKTSSGGKPFFDYRAVARAVKLGVRFLDNCIDVNSFPLENIDELAKKIRRIGIGPMGLSDALIKLGVPYDSDEAVNWSRTISKHFRLVAHAESRRLAEHRGAFPAHKESVKRWEGMRNCNVTTVAPTGSISIIAGCSGGIEPLFAVAFLRRQADMVMVDLHPEFERIGRAEGWLTDDLVERVLEAGTVAVEGVPDRVRRLFRCANEISPYYHLRHQAAWQANIDSAISKTINLKSSATISDVSQAFLEAWELDLKSVTVYRDGSRSGQVLSTGATEKCETIDQGECSIC